MPVDPQFLSSGMAEMLDTWFPMDDVVLSQLREQLQFAQLPAACNVFRRGDACRNYLVVIDGSVRVQALSASGREVVLYRVKNGQSCVITTSCLISQEDYPAEGITETETSALAISQGVFNEALTRSEAFRRFVFSNQGKRLSDLIRRIEEVAFGRVDARLARLLFDRGADSGGVVQATHQQLASELGTAREVISRQLKVFEKNSWIRVQRGSVEVLQSGALAKIWEETH